LLIELGAGSLSALGFAFSWRAYRRCRVIASLRAEASPPGGGGRELDSLEQRLAERESNATLNLAQRNVKALAQAVFVGGLGLFFLALTGGAGHHREALVAVTLGSVGAIACLELRRRIGSLAESWRDATNRRHRRQGVDQPERTG
jgi:hypothetical protein